MKRKIFVVLLCFLLLAGGCASTPKTAFENVNWGMSREEVKSSKPDGKIVDGPSENVLNEIQTDETELFSGQKVSIAYVFTDDRLTGITVQLFKEENQTLKDAMAQTQELLSIKYGHGAQAEENTWKDELSTIRLEALEGSESSYIVLFMPTEG